MTTDFDDLAPVRAFGTWDAPITDGAVRIEVPVGYPCMYCREGFKSNDNGAIMPTGFGQHRECAFRGVMGGIGHHVDHDRYCEGELGTDAGLSYRTSSLLVWRMMVEGEPASEDELEELRRAFA